MIILAFDNLKIIFMKNLNLMLILTSVVLFSSCNNLTQEVENKLNKLNDKTLKLDSLVNNELEKVNTLDSIITKEGNKIKKLDSLIDKSSLKIDSIAKSKMDILKGR